MKAPDERHPLETTLGEEGLDVRAARVEEAVRSRIASLEPGSSSEASVLAVLGHPALAAAAIVAALGVRLMVGEESVMATPVSPLANAIGIGQPLTTGDVDVADWIPSWLATDGRGD